jgi:EF-hand domain
MRGVWRGESYAFELLDTNDNQRIECDGELTRDAFDALDDNKDGKVTKRELGKALRATGVTEDHYIGVLSRGTDGTRAQLTIDPFYPAKNTKANVVNGVSDKQYLAAQTFLAQSLLESSIEAAPDRPITGFLIGCLGTAAGIAVSWPVAALTTINAWWGVGIFALVFAVGVVVGWFLQRKANRQFADSLSPAKMHRIAWEGLARELNEEKAREQRARAASGPAQLPAS